MAHDYKQKAVDLGFPDEPTMFKSLYSTMSLHELAKSLGISAHTLRKKLDENGVQRRTRGGPNYVKVTMNDDVVDEMIAKGAKAVAISQGVSVYTLFKRKRAWLAEHPRAEPLPPDPLEEEAVPEEGDEEEEIVTEP
jgi:DNA-binding Lrp family transcriptional regulator